MQSKKLKIISIVCLTQLRVFRNRAKHFLLQYPLIFLILILLFAGISYFSWTMFSRFGGQLEEIKFALSVGGGIEKFVYNYSTALFVLIFVSAIFYTMQFSKQGLPDVLKITGYSTNLISFSFKLPAAILTLLVSLLLLLPYSVIVFSLLEVGNLGVVLLVFLQVIYLAYFIILAKLFHSFFQYFLLNVVKIRNKEMLVTATGLLSIVTVWLLVFLLLNSTTMDYLPSGYMVSFANLLHQGSATQIVLVLILNLLNLIALAAVTLTLEKTLTLPSNDILTAKVSGFIPFGSRFANPYLLLVAKKIGRNFHDLMALFGIASILIMGAFLIRHFPHLSSFSIPYYRLSSYALVLLVGLSIFEYDDNALLKTLKNLNAGLLKYSLSRSAVFTLLFSGIFAIITVSLCLLLGIKPEIAVGDTVLLILVCIPLASLMKSVLLTGNDDFFFKIFCSYGYLITVFILLNLIERVSNFFGQFPLGFNVERLIMLLMFVILNVVQCLVVNSRAHNETD